MDIQKIKATVERQIENPDWDKIQALAKEKEKQLDGLVSEEGALHLVIRELYPDYDASQNKMSGEELKGRLINKTQLRFVETNKNGKNSKRPVRDVYISTEDLGVLEASLWGKQNIELFKDVNNGDAIILNDVKISDKDGTTVLNIFQNSIVAKIDDKEVKPLSELLKAIDIKTVKKSKIGSLKGFIIQAKDIEYRKCPTCNSKLTEVEDEYHCPEHGAVRADAKKAVEITIDTGERLLSTILWDDILEEGKTPKEMDIINSVCRVYDTNYFKREKAKVIGEDSEDVLNKKYPVDLKLTIYSFELESTSATPKPEENQQPEPDAVPVEQIEDAPAK